MDLHALNISAGELAGEGVAGLVEEDGDELERREQERPPQGEDDDGGDADGGDEDDLVVLAAALQLPVDVHHPRPGADLPSPSPERKEKGGRGGTSARGKWELFELAGETCGHRNRDRKSVV